MVGKNTRRAIPLVSATLTIVGSVIAFKLTQALSGSPSWGIVGAWMAAGIIVTYLLSRLQARSQEQSPEAIKERVSQLEPELRKQVQMRSYGARRNLIEAPLRELDLDVTPRLGWVRDPRLIEPEPISEEVADDIVAAFESSKRRVLIVGEPGSGKTIAAYSLIEYLDNTEGNERVPLLVNLSAWEAQEDFEIFLVDYLRSSVGYEIHERAVAKAFIDSERYSLILDGLDEIPLRLRQHFSERLDEFVRGLPSEVGVVVTCRIQEYEEMLAAHATGLGLVQAVEILPLSSEQLDSAFVELAKLDKDWETFLSQRRLRAYQRVRALLSNPLFLNLAVAGHLSPGQLLDWSTTEQELRDLVLDSYLDRTLVDQREYEPEDARRYLIWIARFLNGAEVSPFGRKTSDYTVFDLANLTPPDPPRRYRLFGGLAVGMVLALGFGLVVGQMITGLSIGLVFGLIFVLFGGPTREVGEGVTRGGVFGLGLGLDLGWFSGLSYLFTGRDWVLVLGLSGLFAGLVFGLVFVFVLALSFGLVLGLAARLVGEPFKHSAVSSRLSLVWPSSRRQLLAFLRRAGRGLIWGLMFGLVVGMVLGLSSYLLVGLYDGFGRLGRVVLKEGLVQGLGQGLVQGLVQGLGQGLVQGLGFGLILALGFGLVLALGFGLLESRSVLITSRTPKEARSRSLIATLSWLLSGLLSGLLLALGMFGLVLARVITPVGPGPDWLDWLLIVLTFVVPGLFAGLVLGLRNGGWFVLLQKVAHRRLARAGNFPSPPYNFLEWGIERQIFRRVGGGVRFRHNLIQQHLARSHQ
jgi:hypothetical protein